MNKKIGSILVIGLSLALLVYSATRSYDFIAATLPADKQILAFFGLAALDFGLLAWLANFLYGAEGGWQRAISMIMIVVDFLGCVTMFTLDTLYNTGRAGMTTQLDPASIQMAVLGLSLVIAINIGATVCHLLADPEIQRNMAQEEVKGQILDLSISRLKAAANAIANKLAPVLAQDMINQVHDEVATTIKTKALKITELPEFPVASTASTDDGNPTQDAGNGTHPTKRRGLTS
ncbi:MAG: hypothetical protein P4L50_03385 [Anaerolineaceae bacterium]|nr:hypothetical protein [Anaerolineaceae bacterium]